MGLTLEYIESLIAKEQYFRVGETTMVICVMTTTSGFMLSKSSRPLDPNDFDMEIGKQTARKHCIDKLFKLETYRSYYQ